MTQPNGAAILSLVGVHDNLLLRPVGYRKCGCYNADNCKQKKRRQTTKSLTSSFPVGQGLPIAGYLPWLP